MKRSTFKQASYIVAGLILIACFVAACSKTGIHPQNFPTSGKADSIAKADTLPTFYSPAGLALDAAGNLYVADYGNNLIRKITPMGIVSTFAGSGLQGSLDGAPAIASFNEPKGISFDASGNLYVADAGNNLIRKVTAAGTVSTVAGSDTTGMADGPAATASFFGPAGVAVDAANNIYVADAGNNLIRLITPAGLVSTIAGLNGVFSNPTGITYDGKGHLFVANYIDNNIVELTTAGVTNVFAGSGQQGAIDGAAGSASFYFPNSVATDAAGNVYVSDGINNLIRKITPLGVVSTLAGSGTPGSTDGTGVAASFNGPAGLVADASGNIYVADSNNNLIRKITPAGVVTTFAGTGAAGSKNGKAFARRTVIVPGVSTRLNIWGKPSIR